MSDKTRIYKVTYGDATRFVEAPSAAAALTHVAAQFFKVEVASPKEIATAMKAGADLETYAPKK